MTEQELMELWGDGTQFGMTELGAGVMTGALNNAFREVAVKFALISTYKAYNKGYSEGYGEGVESVTADVYRMGVNNGVDQAFQQMGEKIRGKAQQFSNPAVRFVLMELSDALIESSLAGR